MSREEDWYLQETLRRLQEACNDSNVSDLQKGPSYAELTAERDQLRRDLATRDRELAEARERTAGWRREFDQARAALAEKEREVAEAREDETAALKAGKMLYDDLTAKLAAAQEEAKGLRAALEQIRDFGCAYGGCNDPDCGECIATRALAARQQQPDGKPDPAPVASKAELAAQHRSGMHNRNPSDRCTRCLGKEE